MRANPLTQRQPLSAVVSAQHQQPAELELGFVERFDGFRLIGCRNDVVAVLPQQSHEVLEGFAAGSGDQQRLALDPGRRRLRGLGFCKVSLGEPEMKYGADIFFRFDGNGRPMLFGEKSRVIQPKAGAFAERFAGEERVENRTQEISGYARPGVLNGKAEQG